MTMSPSPQLSPAMGGSHLVDRQLSNSPPLQQQQQVSKRDKRRTALAHRLDEITNQFSINRDQNYRNQLQALQFDMNMIMEADPHSKEFLPNSRDAIEELVLAHLKKATMKAIGPNPPPRAGKMYADFAKDINDAMEERDTHLAGHERDFRVRKNQIQSANMYRKKLSDLEHKSLATTIRDRLINSVTMKKNRLLKDKDVLEIGESNAQLLHPSQYGISNPASPGGIHGKRATRHRRDADEVQNLPESNKRKRKAHDSDESPAPTRQRTDNGANTPIWKQHQMNMQFNSPLYSIDKLFTERELAMTYNAAALAAHSYMVRQPNGGDDVDTPPNGTSESSADNEKPAGTAETENEDVPSPPGGTGMERQPSTHALRSTRGNFNSGYGVDLLTAKDGAFTPNSLGVLARQIPKMPPLINLMGTRTFTRNDPVVSLPGLMEQDAINDLEVIRRARDYNDQHGYGANLEIDATAKALLEQAAEPALAPYEYWVRSDDSKKPAASALRDAQLDGPSLGLGGIEMVKENSFGGGSIGGTAMSRQATGESVKQSLKGRNIKRRE